jgi:hypothetical protein
MTVRTPPRTDRPASLRDQRGASARIARYVRELSTHERRDRASHRDLPTAAVTQRG